MPELTPAVVLLAGALVVAVAPARLRAASFVAVPLLAAVAVWQVEPGTSVTWTFYGLELEPLRVDRLSQAFAYVFALAAILFAVFGLRITDPAQQVAGLLYAGSALGIVYAGDLLTLFVFWELKVVTSVVLIWARGTARSQSAGTRYLFVHLTGGIVLLGGILWWYAGTGSLTFGAFEMGGAAALVLVGFVLTAAVPPLHSWLADSYPEATVAGTVFLSAFTTKAAVYALARGFPGTELLVWAGVAMALYGVVYAMMQNDIRRLLAYHIVSQVGFMVAAIGIGTETAVNAATAHAFAHILYKGLLLMGTGAVLQATGRSRLTDLGGLARAMPVVLAVYVVAAFSISGVPLLSGFPSKEMVVHAAYEADYQAVVWLLKLASIGTFLSTALKLPYYTWFGPRPAGPDVPVRALPTSMYVAMIVLAGINVAIGLAPGPLLYDHLPHEVVFEPYTLARVTDAVNLLAFTAVGFWLLRPHLAGKAVVTVDTDWFYRDLPPRLARLAPRRRIGAEPAGWRQVVERLRALPERRRVARTGSGAAAPRGLTPTWVLGAVVLGTFVATLTVSLLP